MLKKESQCCLRFPSLYIQSFIPQKHPLVNYLLLLIISVLTRFSTEIFPFSKSVMFFNVVSAIFCRASLVKKAWCPVMITLGKVNNRAKVSSCKICPERSSKNNSSSSSYTSSPKWGRSVVICENHNSY